MSSLNRRKFIKMTGAAGIGVSVAGSSAVVLSNASPNNQIKIAVMGTNKQGAALAKNFAQHGLAEVSYICDVDERAIKIGIDSVKQAGQQKEPQGLKDFRYALDDNDIDAIVMACPIHWHTPASILALSAGKHVYVEKPCSHTPHEGELLVEAARKYNRIVQMGNMRRSWPGVIEAIQRLQDGVIGRVYFARCWYASKKPSIENGKLVPVPSWLDYELWQGPAPRRPYQDNIIHHSWHWFWHWGGGDLMNNGIHIIDMARWGMNVDYPLRVTSFGGRYHWKDDQETPDTQVVTYDFPGEKTMVWEQRSCNPRGIEGAAFGVSFHGENGTLVLDRNEYFIYDNDNNVIGNSDYGDRGGVHERDFVNSIRNGSIANANIQDANKSVHICHLGNIAHRVKRMINCNEQNGHIINDKDAMQYWSKEYEPGWEPVV